VWVHELDVIRRASLGPTGEVGLGRRGVSFAVPAVSLMPPVRSAQGCNHRSSLQEDGGTRIVTAGPPVQVRRLDHLVLGSAE
jgi:hypothetical protein